MPHKPQCHLPQITGAIFAGGESRRMGQPKEGVLLWDGRPMLAHVVDALAPLCEKVAIVGHVKGFDVNSDSRLIHILDRQPGLGPLAALEALLASGLSSHYLVASCDQPLLEASLLQQLMGESEIELESPVFFKLKMVEGSGEVEEFDPFPGLYPASLLPLVQLALNARQYGIRKVLRQVPIPWVNLPVEKKHCLSNCNTPESLAELALLKTVKEAV